MPDPVNPMMGCYVEFSHGQWGINYPDGSTCAYGFKSRLAAVREMKKRLRLWQKALGEGR
jgi:hypothetical protein